MTAGRILGNDKDLGGGFALATPHSITTRVVLTARHVVGDQEPSSLRFLTEDKRRLPVERVERDDDLDIAVLHLSEDVLEGLTVGSPVEEGSWQVEAQPRLNDPKLTGTINATQWPLVTQAGHDIYVLQLLVDQILQDYRGYSGSPVTLKAPNGAVIGVLVEQLRSRLSLPPGQPRPATNILYAIPIQKVLARFDLPYKLVEPPMRSPFMCKDLPPDFVPRPDEFDALISKLLDEKRGEPRPIIAALCGAGGYGKTTMAQALCHNECVRRAFDDGILWVTLGEHPVSLVGKVEDLVYMLSHERSGFTDIDAAGARLAELLADGDILLVVDDAWDATQLKPFLQGGTRSACLITTRDERVVPINAPRIRVDAMQLHEAVQLLSAGLPDAIDAKEQVDGLRLLARRLGEWPLLLSLVNGVLRGHVGSGESLSDALAFANEALDEEGLIIFDNMNAQDRSQAVKKTLDVSLRLLSADEQARYRELAIFPEDVDIPLSTLQKLWGATGGFGKVRTEMLCDRLYRISLLLQLDLAKRVIRLHDVVRLYLQRETGAVGLVAFHNQLLNTYGLPRWADLPLGEPYLWEHLADHLLNAGRSNELLATVKDGRYLAVKTHLRGTYAVEADLHAAEKLDPDDIALRLLKRNFVNMSHLLNRCETLHEVVGVMYSRLWHLADLASICSDLQQDLPRPFLAASHALPDLPHPALIRTLQGHTGPVNGCAVSPLGDWIVSASSDETLKIWDGRTGEERMTLRGHTSSVESCLIHPSGEWILSGSLDGTLRIWDVQTGDERQELKSEYDRVVKYAISPSDDRIMALGKYALMIWDGRTGEQLMWLNRHIGWGKQVVAVSPEKDWDVEADNKALRIQDRQTREERGLLLGHTDTVNACAISPSGDWIVSASSDQTLRVWDVKTQKVRMNLLGHTGSVNACAISPSGDWIVSASSDQTLNIWGASGGKILRTLRGHAGAVNACAISSSGDWIASASDDKTLRVWDVKTGNQLKALMGHTGEVFGCAISPSGDWLVSGSEDGTARIWDTRTEKELMRLPARTGLMGWDERYAISPSGKLLVTGSEDGTVRVWDGETGLLQLELVGHEGEVDRCAAAVSPADDWLVSASHDTTLKVWDLHTGKERMTLYGHIDEVNACAISPSGDWIVSASNDKTLKLWDAHIREQWTMSGLHTDRVMMCVVSSSGDYIVAALGNATLKVWDVRTGIERMTLRGHTRAVSGCAVSPSGDWIVSASMDGTLRIWDAHTGEECMTLRGHEYEVWTCAVSPSGDWIVSGSSDKTLKLWDARTGRELRALRGHTSWVMGCAVAPSGRSLVSASIDGTLKIWDLQTGEARMTLRGHQQKHWVNACAISPLEDWIVSASSDTTLKVWDTRTGAERLTLQGHTGDVRMCAISPMGDCIVSVSADKTVKVWDARTGTCLTTLAMESAMYACTFCPDGEHIIAGSDSGIYILRLLR